MPNSGRLDDDVFASSLVEKPQRAVHNNRDRDRFKGALEGARVAKELGDDAVGKVSKALNA